MKNVKDPMTTVREVVNLKTLYEECLKRLVDQFGLINPMTRRFNQWDFIHCLSGQRDRMPEAWLENRVTVEKHPEWGKGIVIAIKKVGDWYIPGVEFDDEVPNGHALELRDEGILGREGYCKWVYLDELKVVDNSLENRG